jgi:hypothetical protein
MPRVVITFISGRKVEEHSNNFETAEGWKNDVLYDLGSRDKKWIAINNTIIKFDEVETISFYQT